MAKIGWLEKWTLRYAVVGLLFLALTALEGTLMRMQLIDVNALQGTESILDNIRLTDGAVAPADVFYSMLTAHPIVGIYGFAYMCVMGAFYFLVPFLLKKEIAHKKLVPTNFWLQIVGVMIAWGAGFFALFNGLYTLYWPLPVSYDRVPLVGSILFGLGLVLIEVNVLLFVFNIFSTVLSRTSPDEPGLGRRLLATIGIPRSTRYLQAAPAGGAKSEELPVFVVAVGRGSVDTLINAVVILSAGALLLVYGLPYLIANMRFDPAAVDTLLYKNWFWWGLDMIADGNVLMYTAGTWYLLVPLLVGRKLYGEAVVRTVILADLLVSLFVWSHHLLGDMNQPLALRLFSGQFITWGEFLTLGLTIFAVMMTIWRARPITFNPPLMFVMGSIFGFILGAAAGLIQANVGLNVVLHNTQWVIGIHAHTQLLIGLGNLLFAVIYALLPMLTKLEVKSRTLVNVHFWGWMAGGLTMAIAMGMAGTRGMLRRTLYPDNFYEPYMVVALVGALILAVAFAAFLVNLVWTLGLANTLGLIFPEKWLRPRHAPAAA